MPIYEYRCSFCGHELEALQKLSDAPLSGCPQCGKPELTKLVSAAGFQLKGSGWYATDFKGSGAKPAGKATGDKDGGTKPAESASDAKSSGTTETSTSTATTGGCGGNCSCH